MGLSPDDLQELRRARELLESPGLAIRLTELIGRPLEKGVALLPDKASAAMHGIVRSALERGLEFAVATMGDKVGKPSSDRWHKLATATTGAMGGLFGLAGLAVELPVTTVLMLRSIGDVARSEGHSLASAETRLACLEVFAYGSPASSDDAAETTYYAARSAMAKLVTDAAQHLAERGLSSKGAPVLVRLLEKIAARFGLVVQEKAALELVPLVGGVSGALINTLFMSHFQNVARGHFIVRRLEGVYGIDAVRQAYESAA